MSEEPEEIEEEPSVEEPEIEEKETPAGDEIPKATSGRVVLPYELRLFPQSL